MNKYDFSGWATKNNIRCSDGRTILANAFADNDGDVVPLVWQHGHTSPENVLGHVQLQNRSEGVYAFGYFNDTPSAQHAKELLTHGDVDSLSIFANRLKQNGGDVQHGHIVEVSLVLSGANPGAKIENIAIAHGDGTYEDADEAYITMGEATLRHDSDTEKNMGDNKQTDQKNEKTVQDVVDSMTDEQRNVLYFLIAKAVEEQDDTEGDDMGHSNIFEGSNDNAGDILYHSTLADAFDDAVRRNASSLRDVFLAHADEAGLDANIIAHAEKTYGIANPELLFPDAKSLDIPPRFIDRDQTWVGAVLNAAHHTPFTRIKSVQADIRPEEARAKGYITGKRKKDEVFKILKRVTSPTTIYKKQKFDRDDMVDITDFDVIAWVKKEMRVKLDEELARAILIGDGRSTSDDDKVNEENIRPILHEDELYCLKKTLDAPAAGSSPADIVDELVRAQEELEGSGTPTLYAAKPLITELLLAKDKVGRRLYPTRQSLADAIGVSGIVEVPQMKGLKDGTDDVLAIIVNLADYNIGTDKGGEVNFFEDFDIDFNQQKYLLETRCSGALVVPFSALVVKRKVSAG